MAELTDEDVALILKMIDESAFVELHLETKDFKLHVSRRADGMAEAAPAAPSPALPGYPPPPAAPPAAGAARVESRGEGLAVIEAPLLGTFYRSPKPGLPPFVEAGSLVSEDTTVCIVEVMKLMNAVPARMRGRIVEVCAADGQLVEYGQALFRVEPAGD